MSAPTHTHTTIHWTSTMWDEYEWGERIGVHSCLLRKAWKDTGMMSLQQRAGGQSEEHGRKGSGEGKSEKNNSLEQNGGSVTDRAGEPPEVAKWKRKCRTLNSWSLDWIQEETPLRTLGKRTVAPVPGLEYPPAEDEESGMTS